MLFFLMITFVCSFFAAENQRKINWLRSANISKVQGSDYIKCNYCNKTYAYKEKYGCLCAHCEKCNKFHEKNGPCIH